VGLEESGTGARSWRVGAGLATIYLVWGSTYVAIRFAVETLPPFLMAGVRFTLAGGALYVALRLRGARAPSREQWTSALLVGFLMIAVGNGALTWSELRIPSGTAALLVAAMPLWMVLLDWLAFGGRRPRPPVAIGILAGFVGVALLLGPARIAGGGRPDLAGAIVVLLGSLGWTVGSLWSRTAPAHASPLLGTAALMLVGGLMLDILGLATGEAGALAAHAPGTRSLVGFVYLIVVGALVGYTTYMWLLRAVSASLVSTYAYVNPVVAVFLGWLLAGEALTGRTVLAAAVIVAAVALIITYRRPARVPPPAAARATGTG
jgi:drug/metabolite transporter (DMT)-like permease